MATDDRIADLKPRCEPSMLRSRYFISDPLGASYRAAAMVCPTTDRRRIESLLYRGLGDVAKFSLWTNGETPLFTAATKPEGTCADGSATSSGDANLKEAEELSATRPVREQGA